MPGWITHLGIGYLFYKAIPFKLRDLRFFLLGAILPDIASVIWVIALDLLRLPRNAYQTAIWYFQPFHTPFMCLVMSILIGVSFRERKFSRILLVLTGTLTHFFLDAFQKHLGFHQLLGYPFSFTNLGFNIFFSDSPFFMVLDAVSLVILVLVFFVFKDKPEKPELGFDPRSLRFTWVLALFLICFPFLTKESFYTSNFHELKLFSGREDFNGRVIELGISEVVSLNPLKIQELDRIFELKRVQNPRVKLGDRVSVRGVYHDGVIEVNFFHKSLNFVLKIITSLAGGVIFLIYLFSTTIRRI